MANYVYIYICTYVNSLIMEDDLPVAMEIQRAFVILYPVKNEKLLKFIYFF